MGLSDALSRLALVGVVLLVLVPRPVSAANCAVDALVALLRVLDKPVGVPTAQGLGFTGEPPYSLLDLKRAAAAHGVELEGRSCTLEELLASDGPAIVALRDPDHFVTVLNQDSKRHPGPRRTSHAGVGA